MLYTLVTGASGGIGLELAKCAARDGRNLILVARNTTALHKIADELAPVRVITISEDLSQPGAAEKLAATLATKDLVVDTLVNNAGFGDSGAFSKSDPATQASMIALNITALTLLTRLLLPGIIKHHGRIMNVGSVAGFAPGPFMATYFATKA